VQKKGLVLKREAKKWGNEELGVKKKGEGQDELAIQTAL